MLRVRTQFVGATGSPWLSTMYFSGTDTQTEADNAVLAVGAFWGAVDALMNNAVSWTTDPSVAVLGLDGVQTAARSTTSQTGTGGSATELLPHATQALVRWRTNGFFNGREIRGRTFIPALSELSSTAGNVTASSVTTINTAAAALIADANSVLAVWSKAHSSLTSVQTGTCWNQFAVLRSRRD